MRARLIKYLSPPIFDDATKTWQARILNLILLVSIPSTICLLIVLSLSSRLPPSELVFPVLGIALELVLFALLRHGYVRSASLLLVGLGAVILLGKTLEAGRVDYYGYFAYVLPIILGGLLLGKEAVILLTLLGIGSGLAIILRNPSPSLIPTYPNDQVLAWSIASFVFLWTGGLLLLAVKWIDQSLQNARHELESNQETQEKYAQLAAVVEQATESVVITDAAGKVVYVNRSFERMNGATNGESLLPDGADGSTNIRPSIPAIIAPSRSNGNTTQEIITRELPDGSQVFTQTTTFPIKNQSGKIINYAAIGSDITELVVTEQNQKRHLAELNVLHQVAVACAEIRTEDGLIERVTEIIGENFYTENFGILLLDPTSGILTTHPSYRVAPEYREENIPLNVGIVGNAVASGTSWRVGNVESEPAYVKTIPGICSELCVPIRIGDQAIGAIDVESEKLEAFSEHDKRLLETIAGLLATALSRLHHNVDLEVVELHLRSYNERLKALREIDVSILKAQSPEEIAQITAERIRTLVGCQRASVTLFDMKNFLIQMVAMANEGKSSLAAGDILPISAFNSIPYLYERKPFIVNDLKDQPVRSSSDEGLLTDGLRSTVVIPLIAHEELIGSLNLASCEPAYFQAPLVEIASELADSLAVALQNARLLRESQSQAHELAGLYQTAIALTSELETTTLLQRLYEQVQRAIKPDTFAVALFLPNTHEILLALVVEDGQHLNDWEGQRIPLDDPTLLAWIMRTQQSLLVGDLLSDHLPVQPRQTERQARAWLGVPLVVSGRLIGAVTVQSYQPRAFDLSHKRFLESLSVQTAIALENATLFEQTERRLEHVQSLHRIDTAISTSMDLTNVLKVILEQVVNQQHVDAATILILNQHTQQLTLSARTGFHTGALRHTQLQVGESYAGRAALERRIIHIPDLKEHLGDLSRAVLLSQEGFVSYFAAPLETKGHVKGVLEIYHRSKLEAGAEWLEFLETLATQAAIAIENATLFQDLQRTNQELTLAYDTTLEGWSHALELRDRETQGHSNRVVRLMLKLAQRMGISDDQLAHIRRGALLHDIGKMGIPDSILLKTGPLDEDQWGVMRQHPVYAYNLLSQIPYLRPAIDIPYCHHERWDGTGYPQGLRETQIPFAARIFSVIDVWDALLSSRTYRPPWTEEQALEYIRTQSGKLFDPDVVVEFLAMIEEEKDLPD